ncbi:hypothetical protein K9O81_08300 [Leclercia adecarboxylata]|uniref:hypothetical protein n=1 Tax=Leclercia adecarboxylata TaxID=83655 RepID=UPI001CBED613|nr:hypothetical protein [Leclercia adecarboxylata]MBZ3800652.1 hypothetical protein [Leclercia adecarboxylata]MBZ3805031.1 hypothetical protein [Leclercia adecarboxylata]
MKNATRFLVISLALMLSGCAYSPKQVEASRPLVNPAASTTLQTMSANLQQPLNTLPQGAALSANGNTYILGQRYVSALGLECIELLRNRNYHQSQHGVTCKSGDTWYLVPQLEQASASNLLAVQ